MRKFVTILVASALLVCVATAGIRITPQPTGSGAVIVPPTVSFNGVDTITLSNPDATAGMVYTTDGTTPTFLSTRYTAPFTLLSGTYTLKTAAWAPSTITSQSIVSTGSQAETAAWAANIASAGGSVTNAQKVAVDNFVVAAKAHGYWNNLLDVSPLAGADLTSARIKLKAYTGTSTTLTNTNFVSGDYSSTAGLIGASGKYLATGFSQQTYGSAGLVGMGLFLNDEFVPTATEYLVGRSNTYGMPFFASYATTTGVQSLSGSGTVMTLGNLGGQTGRGFYHHARSSLSRTNAYVNGHAYGPNTATITDSAFPNGNQRIFSSENGSSEWLLHRGSFFAIDDGTMGDTKAGLYAGDVQQLERDLGRITPAAYAQRMALVIGQSNAGGAGPVLSTTQPYKNRCFPSFTAGIPATLKAWTYCPLVEVSNETLASGCANLQSQLWRADHSSDASRDLLIDNTSVGSAAYVYLKKGGIAGYSQGIADVTAAQAIVADYGTGLVVPYVLAVHGESDEGSSTYATDVATWQSDYETDIKAITGQSGTIPMLHSQPSAWTSTGNLNAATGTSAYQLLAAYEANPTKTILVCPKYIFAYGTGADGVHLTNDSHRWLGEYYAKVADQLNRGNGWSPLRPASLSRSGAVITVTMSGQGTNGGVGSLVLDTTAVSDPGNYGFEWTQTGGSTQTISSVAVSGNGTVTVTLTGDPGAATNMRLRYAYTGVAGNAGGPTTGPRGCLRDSDTSVTSRNGHTLYNWCVHFDKACP